jgi:hypothetical protein
LKARLEELFQIKEGGRTKGKQDEPDGSAHV